MTPLETAKAGDRVIYLATHRSGKNSARIRAAFMTVEHATPKRLIVSGWAFDRTGQMVSAFIGRKPWLVNPEKKYVRLAKEQEKARGAQKEPATSTPEAQRRRGAADWLTHQDALTVLNTLSPTLLDTIYEEIVKKRKL